MSLDRDTFEIIFFCAAASTFVSWVWFSAYHFMQLRTFDLFKNHIHRSFLWTAAFFLGLPILIAPVTIIVIVYAQNPAIELQLENFESTLLLLSLGSIFLGWVLSYYPQKDRLKKIGAWGWPEAGHEGEK